VATTEQQWMRTLLDAQPATDSRARAAGVTVLAGTDAGQGPHGRIVEQIELLAQDGLVNVDAIGAASWQARRYLVLPGIEEGAPVDYVLYPAAPTFAGLRMVIH
jgi:imidazolonepropionase-like amidohydrolase